MNLPIVLKMFVGQSSENASGPGQVTRVVQLVGVKGPNQATPGPNDTHFDTTQGNAGVSLAGLTDDVKALFKGGDKLKITIEPDV